MVAADPGDHLGVNCIDEGWLNTDGTVYVHTTVPATVTVYLSSDPEVIGYGYNGFPIHADSQTAASGEHIQAFTSEPFDILAAHTYFITAYAIDDDGLSWRYGTATVPHTAVVVVDKITVLNDGDEYSWNEGEISLDVGVDDELLRSTAEDSYDDGDTYNPAVYHPVEGSPPSVDVWATATEDDPGQVRRRGDVRRRRLPGWRRVPLRQGVRALRAGWCRHHVRRRVHQPPRAPAHPGRGRHHALDPLSVVIPIRTLCRRRSGGS